MEVLSVGARQLPTVSDVSQTRRSMTGWGRSRRYAASHGLAGQPLTADGVFGRRRMRDGPRPLRAKCSAGIKSIDHASLDMGQGQGALVS